MAERRYSDEEVAAILGRAAELSAKESAAKSGMTAAEIAEVARQAGIDDQAIARAIGDVDGGHRAATREYEAEIVIDGELDDAGREAVAEIAIRCAGPGATMLNPSSRTMIVNSGVMGSPFRITITTNDGGTRILVEDLRVTTRGLKRFMVGGVGALSAVIVGAGAVGGDTGDLPTALAIGAVTLVGGVATVLGVDKLDRSQRKKRVERTFAALKSAVETHAQKVDSSESALEAARARQGVASVAAAPLAANNVEADVAAEVVALKR